ncbi:MAG: hypothetical protein ACTSWA_03665 [Candidatus Thorarchaeota archaeon]
MKIAKPAKAYRELLDHFEIDLGLTSDQVTVLENNQPILLTEKQLDHLVDQIVALDDIDKFLKKFIHSILPISLSLFVINDRLWKMMERKSWDNDKMLAMSTIPLCAWDKKLNDTNNPKAVKRWTIQPCTFELSLENTPTIKIKGKGGDFSGFIERKNFLPNYIFESLDIGVVFNSATIETYPPPRDDLDYNYSDHASVFSEHGFAISIPGENVTLRVGKRLPTKMLGDVYLLIGSRVNAEDKPYQGLMIDIWLRAFQRRIG